MAVAAGTPRIPRFLCGVPFMDGGVEGGFRTELRIAADYEFMLRVMERGGCGVRYLPWVLVKMRTGGASNRSLANIAKANRECVRAWRMNGYGPITALTAVAQKPLRKLAQLS